MCKLSHDKNIEITERILKGRRHFGLNFGLIFKKLNVCTSYIHKNIEIDFIEVQNSPRVTFKASEAPVFWYEIRKLLGKKKSLHNDEDLHFLFQVSFVGVQLVMRGYSKIFIKYSASQLYFHETDFIPLCYTALGVFLHLQSISIISDHLLILDSSR